MEKQDPAITQQELNLLLSEHGSSDIVGEHMHMAIRAAWQFQNKLLMLALGGLFPINVYQFFLQPLHLTHDVRFRPREDCSGGGGCAVADVFLACFEVTRAPRMALNCFAGLVVLDVLVQEHS